MNLMIEISLTISRIMAMIECWECGEPIPMDEDFKDANEEGFYHEECVPRIRFVFINVSPVKITQ